MRWSNEMHYRPRGRDERRRLPWGQRTQELFALISETASHSQLWSALWHLGGRRHIWSVEGAKTAPSVRSPTVVGAGKFFAVFDGLSSFVFPDPTTSKILAVFHSRFTMVGAAPPHSNDCLVKNQGQFRQHVIRSSIRLGSFLHGECSNEPRNGRRSPGLLNLAKAV